jgi:hypothetical protein
MPYLCFINHREGGVPHFEVLPASSRVGAVQFAARLLRDYDDGHTADIWRGEHLMLSLSQSDAIRINARPS